MVMMMMTTKRWMVHVLANMSAGQWNLRWETTLETSDWTFPLAMGVWLHFSFMIGDRQVLRINQDGPIRILSCVKRMT